MIHAIADKEGCLGILEHAGLFCHVVGEDHPRHVSLRRIAGKVRIERHKGQRFVYLDTLGDIAHSIYLNLTFFPDSLLVTLAKSPDPDLRAAAKMEIAERPRKPDYDLVQKFVEKLDVLDDEMLSWISDLHADLAVAADEIRQSRLPDEGDECGPFFHSPGISAARGMNAA